MLDQFDPSTFMCAWRGVESTCRSTLSLLAGHDILTHSTKRRLTRLYICEIWSIHTGSSSCMAGANGAQGGAAPCSMTANGDHTKLRRVRGRRFANASYRCRRNVEATSAEGKTCQGHRLLGVIWALDPLPPPRAAVLRSSSQSYRRGSC